MLFIENYFEILDKLRKENGVFRASASEAYNATWIRDNYWCNRAYLKKYPEKYLQTCQTHLDFLLKWEREYDNKISWIEKDPDLYRQPSRFIHPKVNFDGSEIEGLEWQFLQLDTIPYLILMMYHAQEAGLNPFTSLEDRVVVQKLINALEAIGYWENDMAHSWEEERAIFTSNLGLCIRAIEASYEMGFEINHSKLRKARLKFWEQFPFERDGRDWDLSLLFICAIDGLLKPVDIEEIVFGVQMELEREHGVIRYKGDEYKPFSQEVDCPTEMEWQMGFGYLAYIYASLGYKEVANVYLDKLKVWGANIPEGTNDKGQPCLNSPLAWSVAMAASAQNLLEGI